MAWIATLSPENELPVRMAMSLTNPWCAEDDAWQHRVGELQTKLVASPADRLRFEQRATDMARDMEAAVREIQEQAAAPPPAPAEPQRG